VLNRFGPALTLATASLAAAVACGLVAGAPYFWVLPAAGLLLGAASGSVDAGLNIVVAGGGSARMLNFIHGAYGVGTVAGPILVTLAIAGTGSWRVAFAVLIGAEIVCSGSWLAVRHSMDDHQRAGADTAGPAPGVLGKRLEAALTTMVVAVPFIYAGAEFSAGQWAASYLRVVPRLPPTAAGFAVAAYWGVFTALRLALALPSRQLPQRLVVRAGCLVALIGAVVLWLAHSPAGSVAGLVVIGAGLAPVFPGLLILTPARLGLARSRHVIGWQLAAVGAGGRAISALTGVLLGRLGLLALGPAMTVLVVLVLVSNEGLDALSARADRAGAIRSG
jgi:fucose permease